MSINCYSDTKLRIVKKLKSAMISVGKYGNSILNASFDNGRDAGSIIPNEILTIVRPFYSINQ
jgi:urocanate hydratase